MSKSVIPRHFWQVLGQDKNGPHVVIMGGTHGDELTGIDLVRRMLSALGVLNDSGQVALKSRFVKRGVLSLGFGNPDAIMRRTRAAGQGPDLNRCFISTSLEAKPSARDSMDLIRARELAPLLCTADFLLDIHATSNPGPPFVCLGVDSPIHREIYSQLGIRYVLTDPSTILGTDFGNKELGTTDYYVNTFGGGRWSALKYGQRKGVAICYETGLETDLKRVPRVLADVLRVLISLGVVGSDFIACFDQDVTLAFDQPRPSHKKHVYALSRCIVSNRDGFIYHPGMDLTWKPVKIGQILGVHPDGTTIHIPEDGMLLFPLAASKVKAGRNLFFTARRIG